MRSLRDIPRGENGRPLICVYCDGKGNSTAGGECGFCEAGVPLDTQEDWDNSWGRVKTLMEMPHDEFMEKFAHLRN